MNYPIGGYNSVLPLGYDGNLTTEYAPNTDSAGAVYAVSDHAGTIPAPSVASPVLHEYHFSEQPRSLARGKVTFTIVLKDGSSRSAVASWVAGGKLHYLDSRAKQYVLTPEMIDRDATEKANEANNLWLELPPG